MDCFNNLCSGNGLIWIMILLLVLGSNRGCIEQVFGGCTVPIMLALAYYIGKNGVLTNLFSGNGCPCG